MREHLSLLSLGARVGAALLLSLPVALPAQPTYPARPVKMVSYVPAGSAADALMRAVATEISRSMGAEFVIENKPGASGALSAATVKSAAPDGYTLLVSGSSFMVSTLLGPAQDSAFSDLTPVALVALTPMVLAVRSDLGVTTLDAFVALARHKPAGYTYASTGTGSIAHVYGALFTQHAGINLLHVPYQTVANSVADVLGGRTDSLFSLIGTVQPHVASGRLVTLAITGETRARAAPDLPTFVEAGYPDMGVSAWNGMFVPAGTPAPVVEKLNAEFAKAAQTPHVRDLATSLGLDSASMSAPAFQTHIDRETQYWRRVIADTGITVK